MNRIIWFLRAPVLMKPKYKNVSTVTHHKSQPLMSKYDDLVAEIDVETNLLAAHNEKLTAELKDAKAANQAPKQSTIDLLVSISARLRSIASDATAPIPPPVAELADPAKTTAPNPAHTP